MSCLASSGRRQLLLGLAAGALTGFGPRRHAIAREPLLGLHAGRDDSIGQYDTFGHWLGRNVLARVTFVERTSWQTICAPYYMAAMRAWLNSLDSRFEVVSVPLVPDHADTRELAAGAAGSHDAAFAALGAMLATTSATARIIVRLGWELNGRWFAWSALGAPDIYARAFRRAALAIRTRAPDVHFDWNLDCHGERGFDWTAAYPGDDVVDIISMDVYDQYRADWPTLRDQAGGLAALREFARSRGKPEAYPEWSVSVGPHGHGDDADFVSHMYDWFHADDANVLYQAYWNTRAGGPDAMLAGDGSGRVPAAAAVYRRRFGVAT